jgi:3-dehydroquinate dehydratase-2
MPKPILILNGPNLNLLGTREPEIYGRESLKDIENLCAERAKALGLATEFRQSNSESELIGWIQGAGKTFDGIIINPAAFSHTSIAILDALKSLSIPIIEVHLSNIHQREEFRHHSYVSKAAKGVICGLGSQGYLFALEALKEMIG